MGSVRHQGGRLPQRVYWVRRSVVLGVALLLVFGITRLIGTTGEDDPDSSIKANTSSAEQQAPAASASLGPVAPSKKIRIKSNAPLAPPSGECRDDDVSVRADSAARLGRRPDRDPAAAHRDPARVHLRGETSTPSW